MGRDLKCYLVFMVLVIAGVFWLGIQGSNVQAKRFWMVDGLLGDASSGQSRYLDQIHSGNSSLALGDYAMFLEAGTSEFTMFRYDSGATGDNRTTAGATSYTVVPYDDPTNGLWTQQFVSHVSGYVMTGSTIFFGPAGNAIFAAGNSAYLVGPNGTGVDFGNLTSKN